MPNRSRPTQLKRQRERALAEKRNQKAAKRQEAKTTRAPRQPGDEDPDIAGIRLGPQPLDPDLFPPEEAPDAGDGEPGQHPGRSRS